MDKRTLGQGAGRERESFSIIIIISILVLFTCIMYMDPNYFTEIEKIHAALCTMYKIFILINTVSNYKMREIAIDNCNFGG